MEIIENLLVESLLEEPIGETDNFIWYITKIGILALEKKTSNSSKFPEKEASIINLDLSKEEKDFYVINGNKLFLYYS